MVIAIDGPAGSGKSTIAKLLAERLSGSDDGEFTYINSGSLYRAITLGCLRAGINTADNEQVIDFARKSRIDYQKDHVFLEGEDVTGSLHTDEIDRFSAPLSAIVPVRHIINDLIRRLAKNRNLVVEGRDMTTVVFPNAECRFYLDASAEARAERRFQQGVSRLSIEEIKETIQQRDTIDKNKIEGSLALAPGVEYIDTSGLTIEEVYAKLVKYIKQEISTEGKNMGQMEVESDTSPVKANENVKNEGSANPGDSKGAVARDDTNPVENVQTQLQEEYLKSLEQLEEGQLVNGAVIQVTSDQVFIDVGYKSEGKIPISEFTEIPKIGDTVSVILITKENKHGEVIVSKQKADVKIFWKNLRQAFQDHLPVEGTIEKIVKGGYDVNLGAGVKAFLPISQSDVQKVDKPEKFIGLTAPFYVERLYSDGKVNIVVNRRKYLEEELEKKRNDFFEFTPIGTDITGVVKSFTSFGAFIDLGGFDGLLHINDMSWGHVTRPKDFVKKGQEIRLKVIRIDPNEKRINLSLKHFTDDPWVHFEDKYHVNDIVQGKVTKLTEFGAFIELEEGIEGLAHISEFSWVKKIQKPSDMVKPNDVVECMILGYDLQAGRVSLGLKQVTENPWNDISEKYPTGTRLTRKVVKLTNAGAFVELEEGIDGFLHADDLSWTKKIKHPGSEIQVGQEIEVMVIGLDRDGRSIKLGVKQLSEDPWVNFADTYRPGSPVEGEVSSITDFGVFVRVPGGIEGLIHKTNLVENRDDNPDEALKKYKVGDKIKAVVLELQGDKQKAAFSIRDYQKKVQREELSRYMAAEESDDSVFTMGDFLKSKKSGGQAQETGSTGNVSTGEESSGENPAETEGQSASTTE
ncbi:MAG TPA: bifunctional cytidylate kinase/30S ribosomal protein S1 [Treponema sp.]|nr:bifunctional cytidylate kinase/30S ribosomal protein S1 [Treponema sp.]